MSDDMKAERRALADAIRAMNADDDPAVLIGFTVVAEFASAGERQLRRTSGDGEDGRDSIPPWTRDGWLRAALDEAAWHDLDVDDE